MTFGSIGPGSWLRAACRGPFGPRGLDGVRGARPSTIVSTLDAPHRAYADARTKIRAGSYDPVFALNYLNAARSTLGEERTLELFDLYLAGQFLTSVVAPGRVARSEWGQFTTYRACAEYMLDPISVVVCRLQEEKLSVASLNPVLQIDIIEL